MSHFEIRPAQVLWQPDSGASSGAGVDWPRTSTPPWDNSNDVTPTGPEDPGVIVASPSISGLGSVKYVARNPYVNITFRLRQNEYPTKLDYQYFGKSLGLWVYLKKVGASTGTETLQWSIYPYSVTDATGGNSHLFLFNNNHFIKGGEFGLYQGWNLLKWSAADPGFWNGSDTTQDTSPTTGPKPVPWYSIQKGGTGATPVTGFKSMNFTFTNLSPLDEVYVDRLELGQYSHPVINIGADANSADIENIMKAKLDQYGYKGYIVATDINTDEAEELTRARMLKANGWDIINHSWTHPSGGFPAMTQDDATYQLEVGTPFDKMEAEGLWPPGKLQLMAYPENAIEYPGKTRLARLYPNLRLCRGVRQRWTHIHPLCGDNLVPDKYETGTFNLGQAHTLNQMKSCVDYAIRLGTGINFFLHQFLTGTPPNDPDTAPGDPLKTYTDHFELLVDHIAQKERLGLCSVLTPSASVEIALHGRRKVVPGGTWLAGS